MKIEARGIRFRAGNAEILAGIDLTIAQGEVLGLIGPNGAGKTTLLRLLAGLLEPAEGEILFDGRAAAGLEPNALARRVAYLAQGSILHWPLRVEAIVALGRLPHRQRFNGLSAADRDAVETAMAEADIAALRHRSFDSLSGGEQRRVLLARALAVQADILLADEPGAALDPYHHLQVMELLGRTARRGAGIVVVLHDLSMAARFCDRLVLLDHGRVITGGRPAEVLSDRHIADVYRVAVERGGGTAPFVIPKHRL